MSNLPLVSVICLISFLGVTYGSSSFVDTAIREYYRGVYSGLSSDSYIMESLPDTCETWDYIQETTDDFLKIFLKFISLQFLFSYSEFDDAVRSYVYKQVDHIAHNCGAEVQAELIRKFYENKKSVVGAFILIWFRKAFHMFGYSWALVKMLGSIMIWDWFEAGRAIGIIDRKIYED